MLKNLKLQKKEYSDYVWKHFRYYHYRDVEKLMKKPCIYRYPVGEVVKKQYEAMLKRVRRFECPPVIIDQSMECLKSAYEGNWEEFKEKHLSLSQNQTLGGIN